MTYPWKPSEFICNIGTPPKKYPPQFDIAAQRELYVVLIFWGGRSKSDSGARGGATCYFRNLSDSSAVDVIIAHAPVRREFPGDDNRKEDWIVTGAVSNFVISVGVAWRATCLYQVSNDHMVNAHLRIRFESGVRRLEDSEKEPWYPAR